ncbi:conserved hypothetical protein [Sphingomonas sp. 8AM]|nr:conserved hypothetical protein [Sphingomonas sp. 8AM]
MLADRQIDVAGLRDEQCRQGHIDVGAVEVEGIAGRNDQPDDAPVATGGLQLGQQPGQRRLRRGRAEHQQQLALEIGDQAEDREPVQPRDDAEDAEDEQRRGQVEGRDEAAEIDEAADAVFADGEGDRAERTERRDTHQDRDDAEHDDVEPLDQVEDRRSGSPDETDRDAEQDRYQQHLQDIALRQGGDQRVRDDVEQETGQRRIMRLGGIIGDRAGIERGGIDVHPCPRLDDIGDDHPDDQRERGEEQEIAECLASDAPDGAQLAEPGDSADQSQEDHGGDHHLDQLDEPVAERLQRRAKLRVEVSDDRAGHDRDQNLYVKVVVKAPRALGFGRNDGAVHNLSSHPRSADILRQRLTRIAPVTKRALWPR